MKIRKADIVEIDIICSIYAKARIFMAANGNPRQWSKNGYPPRSLVEQDILSERLYICEHEGVAVGVFYYHFGDTAEPLYSKYAPKCPYGVVHRIASDGTVKRVGRFCLSWAIARSKNLMIDTHTDNKIMQGLLSSLGFTYVGNINIPDDEDIRLVFLI